MAIKIIGDSTMDLSPEAQKRLGIPCIPFTILFGEEAKHDTTFTNEEMFQYNRTHKDLCTTSAVNVGELMNFFEEEGKNGDELLYFSISAKMSSGYQNARIAANGNPKIHPYDSESASLGIALQALKAKEMAEEGKSMEEILSVLDTYKKTTNVTLIVDDLTFFAKGGRISKAAALGAGLFKIHPILTVKDGTFSILKKLVGKTEKLLKKYVDTITKDFADIDYSTALVGYTSSRSAAVDTLIQALKDKGFKEVHETQCNATNSVHSGPKTFGVAFICSNEANKKRHLLGTLNDRLNAESSKKAIEEELKKSEEEDKK